MKEEEFRGWLKARDLQDNVISTRMSGVRRIERKLSGLGLTYSDIDAAFDADGLESVRAALKALQQDAEQGGAEVSHPLSRVGYPHHHGLKCSEGMLGRHWISGSSSQLSVATIDVSVDTGITRRLADLVYMQIGAMAGA